MKLRFLLPLLLLGCAHQPQLGTSAYGLPIVERIEAHRELVRRDPEKALVDVAKVVPGVILDIHYATSNNFMKRVLYPEAAALLRCPAARALARVQSDLSSRGLGLKVFDAYRPYSVTVAMWEPIRNPDYVADPAKGSRHNRGAAVDLTLIDLGTGRELEMPTEYDDFTPRAAHEFMDLPDVQLRNRALLREVMERHGFVALPSKWWHYDFRGWERFEVLDLPHESVRSDTPNLCRGDAARRPGDAQIAPTPAR